MSMGNAATSYNCLQTGRVNSKVVAVTEIFAGCRMFCSMYVRAFFKIHYSILYFVLITFTMYE